MATSIQPASAGFLERLIQYRVKIAYGLLGSGLTLLIFAFFLFAKYKSGWEYFPVSVGCMALGLLFIPAGLLYLVQPWPTISSTDAARLLVLIVGGLTGLILTFVAFWQIIIWWEYLSGGIESWQGPGGFRILMCLMVILSSLGIMFASLLAARAEEQEEPLMRRLLYGFNTVLTGLLVLAICIVINILSYLYLPAVSDWTATGMYTLSSQSINILKGLDKPVKVYLLISSRADQQLGEVRVLLDNCRQVTDKLQYEDVLRDRNLREHQRLLDKYHITNALGLLVVYGTEPHEEHQFIKLQDMYDLQDRNPRASPRFKGEDALMTTLSFLSEGRAKPVIYFTQGHGELDIEDSRLLGPERQAGTLLSRLETSNHEVKGLRLSSLEMGKGSNPRLVVSKQVPDDAAVVVIASPRQRWQPTELEALRNYLSPVDPKKKKGKLLVLLDVETDADHKMVRTGLEDFLSTYQVDVGNNRIFQASNLDDPSLILVGANPSLRDSNPVAAAMGSTGFLMRDVRTVRSRTGTTYRSQDLLLVPQDIGIWVEEDLRAPQVVIRDYLTQRRQPRASNENLPVAVAVSEAPPFDPRNPQAPAGDGQKPVMLVIGNASFVSNAFLSGNSAQRNNFSLFASGIAWLREKPNSIGIAPKDRATYTMGAGTNVQRMFLLPAALMGISILGLGLGVWIVRQR